MRRFAQRFVDMDFMFSAALSRAPRQWLSGHSSPSTDNARSCDRSRPSPAGGRFQQRLSPAPPAAFYRKYRDRWPRSAGAVRQRFSPPLISWLVEPTASAISTIDCGDSGMDKHGGFGMQSLHPHQRLGFKLVVHDARPLPAQHVCAGLTSERNCPRWRSGRPEDLSDPGCPDGQ